MKQDVATYLMDSFIDFAGKEHKIIACALSQTPETSNYALRVGWVNKQGEMDIDQPLCHDVFRMVTIGIAICNPSDNFDEETGRRIAFNKAANIEYLPRIYVPGPGIITKELVIAFLEQQVQFVKENPERVIKGYNQSKLEYEKIQRAKQQIENLTDKEKVVFDLAKSGADLSKYTELANIYNTKIHKYE